MPECLEIGSIPFYWRSKQSAVQPPLDVPARLPFAFGFDDRHQLVVQRREPTVLRWLERVYTEHANVGYLQEGHALADVYGGEFINFFARAVQQLASRPQTVADIGCGGVYLLQRLREFGYRVTGLDPSPVTVEAGAKAGIEIVPAFYPSAAFTARFDALIHYDVLEHVEDPVSFLRAHHENLSSRGIVVFAVPDCTDHVALGDLSMILHEHLNYFDIDSLDRVVQAAGFRPILLERARHGGVLLCAAAPADESSRAGVPMGNCRKFDRFVERSRGAMERFGEIASSCEGRDLGLYVPLRAFPYLSSCPSSVRLRLFDDDPGLHGRFYDGFEVAIESATDLASRAPFRTLICSHVFGRQIADRLRGAGVDPACLIEWSELFRGGGFP